MLESAGLAVQLVTSSQARNLPGRPKTDRLDSVWLARLTERGMLRPVVRAAGRDPGAARTTPARTHLVQDRTRRWQRLEKLLEDALTSCPRWVSELTTVSGRGHARGDDRGRA